MGRTFSDKKKIFMHAQPRPLSTLISPSSIPTVESSFSHRVPSPSSINKYTACHLHVEQQSEDTYIHKYTESSITETSELLKPANCGLAVICLARKGKEKKEKVSSGYESPGWMWRVGRD